MPDAHDIQKALAAMPPAIIGRGDDTPLAISVTLTMRAGVLEGVAAESRRRGCSFEELVVEAVEREYGSRDHPATVLPTPASGTA